jgi:hypothetical protein
VKNYRCNFRQEGFNIHKSYDKIRGRVLKWHENTLNRYYNKRIRYVYRPHIHTFYSDRVHFHRFVYIR